MITQALRWLLHIEQTSREAHDIKNDITRESLKTTVKLMQSNRAIEQTTAYKIAVATGKERNGQ